ncbi:MAG: hypothetical protein K0U54_10020, partial [Bacteroidetes bacterium]|nr:hypothetical protein [Bacteroidota bacterium]
MKIVHVTSSSKGGAGIAALRLHHALRAAGVASDYVSKNLTIDFDGKLIEDTFFAYKKPSLVQRVMGKLKRIFSIVSRNLERQVADMQTEWDVEMVSSPYSNFSIDKHPLLLQSDVVNLHMVTGMLSYETFFSECRKPIVWTLHDMNPFLGLFHYQGDHEKYISAKQLDTVVQKIKVEGISKINKGAIVSPSKWLLTAAQTSKVFKQIQSFTTIANGIDLQVFQPQAASLRGRFGISKSEKVLLFVAAALSVERKGGQLLLEALEQISFPITLLTLGKGVI